MLISKVKLVILCECIDSLLGKPKLINMKRILFILLLLPLLSEAQNNNTWQLLTGRKILLKGNIGEQKSYKVLPKDIAKLKIRVNNVSHDNMTMENTFIIMDENRKEIFRKELKKNEANLQFSKTGLGKTTFSKSVIVYLLSIPTDPSIASKIRVRPMALVKLIPKR